jgi:SAM-dependent methyltransferase
MKRDIKNNNYQDYFIKDGVHVGDYEAMYRNSSDPWNIERLGLRLDMKAALLLLDYLPGRPRRVLDLGAGAGLFSLELYKVLTRSYGDVTLFLADLSETALGLARERFSLELGPSRVPVTVKLDIRKLPDLLKGSPEAGEASPEGSPEGNPDPDPLPDPGIKLLIPASFKLVVLCQTLWGIMENLKGALEGVKALLAPEGALLISQHFPGEERQIYGRSVTGPKDLSLILTDLGFTLIHSLETDRETNSHWGSLWRN